jgi:hypothetical protein
MIKSEGLRPARDGASRRPEAVSNSEIRNDMMTGSSYEPSQNVILSEARRKRAKSKDLRVGDRNP